MTEPKRTQHKPPPDTGPESVLPGQRSGEGVDDLFQHILRDERRKAGLGKGAPLDRGTEPRKDDAQQGDGSPPQGAEKR